MSDVLKVNEIFGPTIQGEGPSAGQRCSFLRLSGCNLTCSWCDTPYTWDWGGLNGKAYDQEAETKLMGIDQVWEDLQSRQTPLIVISGGEPMMQQAALSPLVKHLIAQGKRVEIETNGTIKPIISPTRFNVSPKLAHSGVLENKRRKFDTLNLYVGKGIFKFVCQHESDFDEIEEFIEGARLPREDIWIMPEGIERIGLLEHEIEITEAAILRGWNVTSRLHVLTWGARRGV